jgi:hypothetical protein
VINDKKYQIENNQQNQVQRHHISNPTFSLHPPCGEHIKKEEDQNNQQLKEQRQKRQENLHNDQLNENINNLTYN